MKFGARHFVRFIVGGLFIWAAIAKLIAPTTFFGALLGYELPLADVALRFVAISLPWLELILGVLLLLNVWPETVRPMAFGLCLIFVVTISQALIRGLSVECGCFGGAQEYWFNQPPFALARAIVLAGAVLWLCKSPLRSPGR